MAGYDLAQGDKVQADELEQIYRSAGPYAADAGANDTYVIAVLPAPSSLETGMVFRFKANTANTGPATLNVNSLGAKTIVKGVSTALADGDIPAGSLNTVIYDGTNFVLQSPTITTPESASAASISGSGITTTQNFDIVVPTTFTPRTITVDFYLKGFSGVGVATYTAGKATFEGTTIKSVFYLLNQSTATTISAATLAVGNSSPIAGDGVSSNGTWTMSVVSLSSTGFTLRLTYTQGSTFNGGDYKAMVSATA